MEKNNLNELSIIEIDTIGEILNISMGSAATSLSTMLDMQVNITTPNVKIIESKNFECKELEPGIGIEIGYIKGLHGSNFMIMKKRDIRALVEVLIGEGYDEDDDSELNEMQLSAVGEIMNQMMGASSTALAQFFAKDINISPPTQFDPADIKENFINFSDNDSIVTVSFDFKVEGLINSEFITILPIYFAKEMVKNAINPDNSNEKETPKPEAENSVKSVKTIEAKNIEAKKVENKMPVNDLYEKQENKVNVQPLIFESFDQEPLKEDDARQVNFNLVMGVELEVSVEIGRTKKPVKDVLELRAGSVVELDKQAGDPVDVIVNGQLIARGDVVVIEDNFGVRITEIISNKSKN